MLEVASSKIGIGGRQSINYLNESSAIMISSKYLDYKDKNWYLHMNMLARSTNQKIMFMNNLKFDAKTQRLKKNWKKNIKELKRVIPLFKQIGNYQLALQVRNIWGTLTLFELIFSHTAAIAD